MRLADYIMYFLEEKGIKHIFMLSGGGIMYLVDALGHSSIKYICCHHEQAAGIAAQAYAMDKNSLGVCMITTGPGGTNALTAAGAAYMDSTPMLFISGQVKTADFASIRNVRQFGAQENDIVSMAKPVTKYAATVMKEEDIRYHLEKAVFLAMNGRQGPVWLDIPLDIQNAEIDTEKLRGFSEDEVEDSDIMVQRKPNIQNIDNSVETLVGLLQQAKRPLFLIGHGIEASNSKGIFENVLSKVRVPVVSTWRALDIMDFEDELFYGSPGLQANRYSNLITQGADLLVVLGSRLDNMITAFNEEHFAFRAKVVIVDLDENEINKLAMKDVLPVVCDVALFLERLEAHLEGISVPEYTEWILFCKNLKEKYPLLKEKQEIETDMVDLYQLSMKLSEYCVSDDVFVISSTSRCNTAGHIAFKHKKGQRTISSMGFGSMGFALPSVVGAWFASDGNRVIMLEGDGSLQLNIQELQTIVYHNINAKMFIFHNKGYAAIATMQNRNFDGFHVGSDEESGVTMPNLQKISEAYEIPYFRIEKNQEIDYTIQKVMETEGAVICEFVGSITFDEIPKCISSLDENGVRISAALENPFPFLSEEEMNTIYRNF